MNQLSTIIMTTINLHSWTVRGSVILFPQMFSYLVLSESTSESSTHSPEQTFSLLRSWRGVSCPALWSERGRVVKSFKQSSKCQCCFAPTLSEVSASYKFLWLSAALQRETGSPPTVLSFNLIQTAKSGITHLLSQIFVDIFCLLSFPSILFILVGLFHFNPLMSFQCGL